MGLRRALGKDMVVFPKHASAERRLPGHRVRTCASDKLPGIRVIRDWSVPRGVILTTRCSGAAAPRTEKLVPRRSGWARRDHDRPGLVLELDYETVGIADNVKDPAGHADSDG